MGRRRHRVEEPRDEIVTGLGLGAAGFQPVPSIIVSAWAVIGPHQGVKNHAIVAARKCLYAVGLHVPFSCALDAGGREQAHRERRQTPHDLGISAPLQRGIQPSGRIAMLY